MATILLGISASISAYKVPYIIRFLKKQGHRVIPVLSQAATQFVTPLTIEVVAEEKAWTDTNFMEFDSPHLKLTREADLMITVPCSANTLTKYCHGISDSLLTACFLSFQKQKIIAPAMHSEMWNNQSIQENISQLKKNGVFIVGPTYGALASGDEGDGRLADLAEIDVALHLSQYDSQSLQGKSILITAGGTSEIIDPVRILTNRSTGKLGHILSIQAALMGASVTLITTQSFEFNVPNVSVINVNTAAEMATKVKTYFKKNHYLYMAAAVSDFTIDPSHTKIRRQNKLTLSLNSTKDILQQIAQCKTASQKVIGFCLADQSQLKKVALEKLKIKNLDGILASTPKAFGQLKRDVCFFNNQQESPVWSGKIEINKLCYQLLTKHQIP